MASVNKVILVGNLGRDPETRTFNNGSKIASVRIATTEYWTDRQSGEKRELTEWHTVIFGDRLADVAERYLRKGSSIYVEGKLRTRSWDDKQSGQKRYATEIRADVMQMLGGKPSGDSAPRSDDGYRRERYDDAPAAGSGGYSEASREYMRQSGSIPRGNAPQPQPQAQPAQRAAAPAFNEMPDDDIPF